MHQISDVKIFNQIHVRKIRFSRRTIVVIYLVNANRNAADSNTRSSNLKLVIIFHTRRK